MSDYTEPLTFAERLDADLCSPCPGGCGRSSLLCECCPRSSDRSEVDQ